MRTAGILLALAALAALGWLMRADDPPPRELEPAPESVPAESAAPPALPPPAPRHRASLEVHVRDEHGRPLEAVTVSLTYDEKETARGKTDRDGRAHFPDRTRRWLDVWVHPPGHDRRLPAGRFRTYNGDARMDYVLRGPRSLIVRVLDEGVAGLPGQYHLQEPVLFDVAVDREAGEIRGRFYPTGKLRVVLNAPGFFAGGAVVGIPEGPDPLLATVELRRVVPVRLGVLGDPELIHALELQRLEAGGRWLETDASVTFGEEGERHELAPGWYRVVLRGTRAIVREFEVRAGQAAFAIDVDLRRAGWQVVRVEVPPELQPGLTGLQFQGERLEAGAALRKKLPYEDHPRFLVPLPGDRTIRLIARHPQARPVPGRGDAVVEQAGGELTLRLAPAPLVRFTGRLPPYALPHRSVEVRFFRKGELVYGGTAFPVGEEHAVAGWTPGTYTVVIEFNGLKPHVVPDASVPAEGVDLGRFSLEHGAAVLFRPAGEPEHDAQGTLVSTDSPYFRYFFTWRRPYVTGLVPGSYRVVVEHRGGRYEDTLTVAGNDRIEKVIDLR